jgi:Skp family chaperone for outer membrane proteins
MKADKTIENILDITAWAYNRIDIQDSEIKHLQSDNRLLLNRIENLESLMTIDKDLDYHIKQHKYYQDISIKQNKYISRLEDKLQQVKSDYEIDDYSLNLDEIYKKGV